MNTKKIRLIFTEMTDDRYDIEDTSVYALALKINSEESDKLITILLDRDEVEYKKIAYFINKVDKNSAEIRNQFINNSIENLFNINKKPILPYVIDFLSLSNDISKIDKIEEIYNLFTDFDCLIEFENGLKIKLPDEFIISFIKKSELGFDSKINEFISSRGISKDVSDALLEKIFKLEDKVPFFSTILKLKDFSEKYNEQIIALYKKKVNEHGDTEVLINLLKLLTRDNAESLFYYFISKLNFVNAYEIANFTNDEELLNKVYEVTLIGKNVY